MNFMVIVNAFILVVVVAVMASLPEISRSTVPLGVSVPSDRVRDPVVTAAIRRFRTAVIIAGAVALAGMLATFILPTVGFLWILGYVVVGNVIYVQCRRPIVAAKQQQGWYDGAEVRVMAAVTPEPKPVRVPWALYAFAAALVVAGAVTVLSSVYPSVPDPMPIHWNAAGVADGFAAKSVLQVLLPALIGLALIVGLVAVAWAMTRRHDPKLPDGNPEVANRVADMSARTMQGVLGWSTLAVGAVCAFLSVLPVLQVSSGMLAIFTAAAVVVTLVPVIWGVVTVARHQRAARASGGAAGEHPEPQSPDDDRYWQWGLVYYNPADARAFVPKRVGMGLTINFGHPLGLAFSILAGLILVGAIVLVVLSVVTGM